MATTASKSSQPIRVERITVKTGRLQAVVAISNAACRFTNAEMINRVLQDHPSLPIHSCINSKGPTFAAVMDHTSVPHLLEQLVIDAQVDALARKEGVASRGCAQLREGMQDATFVGNTRWLDKGAGQAQIEVSFTDDMDALQAFNGMLDYLNESILKDVAK